MEYYSVVKKRNFVAICTNVDGHRGYYAYEVRNRKTLPVTADVRNLKIGNN